MKFQKFYKFFYLFLFVYVFSNGFKVYGIEVAGTCPSLRKETSIQSEKVGIELNENEFKNEKKTFKTNKNMEKNEVFGFQKEMNDWIVKMKDPNMELPHDGKGEDSKLDKKEKHWIHSCKEGTLGIGLKENLNGKIEGQGKILFHKNSFCYKEHQVVKVIGTFIDGLLDGKVTIHFDDLSRSVATFRQGILNGLSRRFHCKFGQCDFDIEAWNNPDWLTEVC
jgi:hypothetical protein